MTISDVFTFPSGENTAPYSQVNISDEDLADFLDNHNIENMQIAFPDFSTSDISQTTRIGTSVDIIDWTKLFVIRLADSSGIAQFIDTLNSQIDVIAYAESNDFFPETDTPPQDEPDDPDYSKQWGLNYPLDDTADINAPEAWSITTGSSNITIGIFDAGMKMNDHEDLETKLLSSNDEEDDDGHAYYVAGIAAAVTDNFTGMAGVDWHAKLLNKNVTSGRNISNVKAAERIVSAAIEGGIDVSNSSWSTSANPITIHLAYITLHQLGIFSTATTGNTGVNQRRYPGGWVEHLFTVGATNRLAQRTASSTFGDHIDLAAPGGTGMPRDSDDIWSAEENDGYRFDYGTSAAAPHVTGTASLLLSLNSNLEPIDIEKILTLTAEDVNSGSLPGYDIEIGHGRLDAEAALKMLQSPNQLYQTGPVTGTAGTASHLFFAKVFAYFPNGNLVGKDLLAKVTPVTATIQFSDYLLRPATAVALASSELPAAWGNGDGYLENIGTPYVNWTCPGNDYVTLWGTRHAEIVPGTLTNTGCQVRTYVYDLYEVNSGWVCTQGAYIGQFPETTSQVTLRATVIGVPLGSPTSVSATLSSNDHPLISWTAFSHPDISGYNIYRRIGTGGAFEKINTSLLSPTATQYEDTELDALLQHQQGSQTAYYYLKTVHNVTESDPSNTASIIVEGEGGGSQLKVGSDNEPNIVYEFKLNANYPNPFNPETNISFELPDESFAKLTIYNTTGQLVRTLVAKQLNAGLHKFVWKGRSDNGEALPSGIYLYKLVAGEFTQTRKMTLLK